MISALALFAALVAYERRLAARERCGAERVKRRQAALEREWKTGVPYDPDAP